MSRKESLKRRLKKLNLSTIFFFALSLVSSTFAWFAYSNMVDSNVNIELKTWDIELTENNSEISQVLNIDIDDFSPGVDTYTKTVKITNNGDLDAAVDFEIVSLRILDDTYDVTDQEALMDELAHDYPFFFNFKASSTLVEASTEESFKISIGWPLDSGDDAADSSWGADAYEFYHNEQVALANDPSYQIRPCIDLVVKLNTRQYVEESDTNINDNNYKPGTNLYNDLVYVLDNNNLQSDTTVGMLYKTEISNTYGNHNILNRSTSILGRTTSILASDIVKLVSTDIYNTKIVKTGISDRILGVVNNDETASDIVNYLITNEASIVFDNADFEYLKTVINDTTYCYWTGTEVDSTRAFAIKTNGTTTSLYIENKTENCLYMGKLSYEKDPIFFDIDVSRYTLTNFTEGPYIAKEGMTWASWIFSTGFTTGNGVIWVALDNRTIMLDDPEHRPFYLNGEYQYIDTVILNNTIYGTGGPS